MNESLLLCGAEPNALSTNQKLNNIRGRIDKVYEDMIKPEGFTAALCRKYNR